jgi:transposase-like protein
MPQFPKELRSKLHSTNTLERLNKEVKRRTNVVGIFPNEEAVERLVGAVLLEQHEDWAVTRRYMPVETLQTLCHPDLADTPQALAAE